MSIIATVDNSRIEQVDEGNIGITQLPIVPESLFVERSEDGQLVRLYAITYDEQTNIHDEFKSEWWDFGEEGIIGLVIPHKDGEQIFIAFCQYSEDYPKLSYKIGAFVELPLKAQA